MCLLLGVREKGIVGFKPTVYRGYLSVALPLSYIPTKRTHASHTCTLSINIKRRSNRTMLALYI